VAGERGAVGVGTQGEKGEKGDRGEQGEKGEKGDMPFLTVQHPLTLKDKRLGIDLTKLKKSIGGGVVTGTPVLYDGGGGLGEAFKFISVSGQSGLTAVQYDKETLTFVAGNNITLTTDPDNNAITIASVGGQGGVGPTGAIPTDYVSSINSLTGAVGLTVAGNLTLSLTGADNKTLRLYSKPYATVKGTAGAIAWADTGASFAGDGSDLGADNSLKFNYLTDLSLETPGSIKLGTLYSDSFIEFGDGTTQGTACVCGGGVSNRFSFGATAPTGATSGDRWVSSILGKLFTYVDDGDSSQWIEFGVGPQGAIGATGATGAGVTGAVGATGATGATGPSEDVLTIYIDSTPDDISVGKKAFRFIPYDCNAVEWYVIAGQTGSIEFDIKKSSFANYPTTTSIVGSDYPGLSGTMKNSNAGITSWGGLSAGDVIDFAINSNTGIQSVGLFIKIRRTS
jgi:hypothetical protein